MLRHLFISCLLIFSMTIQANETLYDVLSREDETTDYFKDVDFSKIELVQPESVDFLDVSFLNKVLKIDKEKSIFVPLELTNQELIALAAATSLGVIAFANDQQISDTVQQNQSVVADKITSVGNFIGETAFAYIAAGSYFLGVVMKDNKIKQAGLFIVGAELAQSIVTTAVKGVVGRSRPKENVGPYEFGNAGQKSFYSGHTATAFTLATVISETFKDDYPIVPYVAYGLASLTAYARVHGDNHWASDVLIGAIAGHLIAKLALSAFNQDLDRKGITITPEISPNGDSFRISVRWTPRSKKSIFN